MPVAEEVKPQFGENVYRYIQDCSDSTLEKEAEKEGWKIRKERSIVPISNKYHAAAASDYCL